MEAFKKYDFPRSSHHLQIFKINLHLFDDSSENCMNIFLMNLNKF